jgi:hypothetical protein
METQPFDIRKLLFGASPSAMLEMFRRESVQIALGPTGDARTLKVNFWTDGTLSVDQAVNFATLLALSAHFARLGTDELSATPEEESLFVLALARERVEKSLLSTIDANARGLWTLGHPELGAHLQEGDRPQPPAVGSLAFRRESERI